LVSRCLRLQTRPKYNNLIITFCFYLLMEKKTDYFIVYSSLVVKSMWLCIIYIFIISSYCFSTLRIKFNDYLLLLLLLLYINPCDYVSLIIIIIFLLFFFLIIVGVRASLRAPRLSLIILCGRDIYNQFLCIQLDLRI
jgi:amino acid transporter